MAGSIASTSILGSILQPRRFETWTGSTLSSAHDVTVGPGTPMGISFDFKTHAGQAIQAKVGISFISAEQAKQNVSAGDSRLEFRHPSIKAADGPLECRVSEAQPRGRDGRAEAHALYGHVPHHADADGSHGRESWVAIETSLTTTTTTLSGIRTEVRVRS